MAVSRMEKNFLQRVKARLNLMMRKAGATARQERSRESFTFLGFVLLSLAFWFMQGLNDEVEGSFEVPVELQELPEKVTLINDLPAQVEVRLRDRGPAMLGYMLKGLPSLVINFKEYDRGGSSFALLPFQLDAIFRESLRSTTRIVSMKPDTVKVLYTHNAGKRVRLVVKGSATTIPQCVLSGDMTANVDSVMVYGDAASLSNLHAVYTTDFEVKRLNDTLRTKVDVAKIPNLRIVPDVVTVTVPVEEITAKTIDVPIVPQNLPADWRLTIFPSTIQLTCMIPFSKFAEVDESSFLLGVDVPSLSYPGTKLGIEVLSAPEFVRNITLSQDSVDYILMESHAALPDKMPME